MGGIPVKEETLYGHPRYEVENLADTIMRAKEAEKTKPDLHSAALKLLQRRQSALGAVLKSLRKKRG